MSAGMGTIGYLVLLAGSVFLVFGCSGSGLETHLTSQPTLHRATVPTCPGDRPQGACGTGGFPGGCTKDADCTAGVNGRCNGNPHDGCSCS